MDKYFVMGNFSQKAAKRLLTGDTGEASVVKKTCEAIGCKSHSYVFIEGQFDFILVLEGETEQIFAAKQGAMKSGDLDGMTSFKLFPLIRLEKT